jgi:hypothetical protein
LWYCTSYDIIEKVVERLRHVSMHDAADSEVLVPIAMPVDRHRW